MRRSSLRQREGEYRVLLVLHQQPTQSLDDIALSTNYARCTVWRIIKRLEHTRQVIRYPGKGRKPNRYEIPDVSTFGAEPIPLHMRVINREAV